MSRLRASLEHLDASLDHLEKSVDVHYAAIRRRERELAEEMQKSIQESQVHHRMMADLSDRLDATIAQLEDILEEEDENAAA